MTTHSPRHGLVFAVLGAVLAPSEASAQSAGIFAGAPATTIDTPSAPESPASGEDGPVLEKLTFDVAIQRALDRNPTSLEAAAEIRRYGSLMEQVRASSLPTLSAGAAYTRLDANRVAGAVVLEPDSGLNLSATLSVPLVNVRGWVQWQQAGDQVDVARLTAADVRRTLAVTAGRAYLTVIKERRLLETARTARDNAKAHYDFTHTQLLGGIGNRLDDVRAAQELTTDEVLLQNQEAALFLAREALGVLVVGEGAIDAREWTFGPMPQLSDGLNDAQSLRSDVRARRAAAKAADRTVNQAYADYLPYLNLVASPFYQNPAVPTVPQTGWQAALVLGVPLYDGGLRYGQEHDV
jgi:outer membrane protein TolC